MALKTMGLRDAPRFFQSIINQALSEHLGVICAAYLDDIIVVSENEADHATHVELVLEALRKANFKLKKSKCHLFAKFFCISDFDSTRVTRKFSSPADCSHTSPLYTKNSQPNHTKQPKQKDGTNQATKGDHCHKFACGRTRHAILPG